MGPTTSNHPAPTPFVLAAADVATPVAAGVETAHAKPIAVDQMAPGGGGWSRISKHPLIERAGVAVARTA